jgi:CRISPR system CASCADE complex protein casC
MKKRLYVDFHVLQTVPPSCINRDDTGSPKTAIYGGVTRARVSSQAWKHAMRQAFVEESLLDEEDVGKRTKKVTELVEKEIAALAPEKDAAKLAKKTLDNAGIKNDEKGTKALFFISQAQIKALAQLAVEECADKKEYKKALSTAPSADIALFGRMVADDPSLNFDAAAQVAHSISTHAVQNEYDYFTAVDDCQVEDNAGAGHLGTVEYNSATLYRYATVNVMELERHLGAKKAAEVVRSFGEAFIRSMPTGKQNTFANRTLPDAVYVTIREDQPVNLCGAFERAVRKSTEGYAEPSKSALQAYAQQLYQSFAEAPAESFTVGTGLEALAPAQPLNTMLDALEEAVKENLTGNEVE